MRKIISFSMHNKLAVWLLTLLVVVGGLYAGTHMKMETMPDFTIPVVSVTTVYPGGTPSAIDDQVTQPIEQKLQSLAGVKDVSSTSASGISSVVVEYDYSQDMDKAVNDIKQALDQVTLPDNAQKPSVMRISLDAMPVYSVSITGSKQMNLDKLSQAVKDDLLPKAEQIDGVSSVTLAGQQKENVQIAFKANKLKKYGLTQDTVVALIKANNVSTPLGLYTIGKNQRSVVVSGHIDSINHLKSMRIPVETAATSQKGLSQAGTASSASAAKLKTMPSASASSSISSASSTSQTASSSQSSAQLIPSRMTVVQLSDVANVTIQKKAESISRTNGKLSIGLSVVKGQDANTVDVVNRAKSVIKSFEKSHTGIHAVSMYDQGKPIQQSVSAMFEKAILGALFAMLIILLFLRNIRTTLISVLSIPLSLLIALIVLKQMNVTLNIMTLGAMTIAIGRVVDDSIVVIENIYRRMSLSDEKLSGRELIREATHEMFLPIMSSTIVTIAVFLPMALVTGVVGQIFLPFAMTIVFSLLASLLVAITIVPMMANSLFPNGLKRKHAEEQAGKLAAVYRRALNGVLNHKLISFGLAVLIFVASLFLVPHIGASFLPDDQQKEVIFTYNPNPGQTVNDTKKTAARAEHLLEANKDLNKIQYSIGGSSTSAMFQSADNQAMFFVSYKDSTPNFTDLQNKTLDKLNKQGYKGKWAIQNFGSGSSSNQLTLYVYSNTQSQLKTLTNKVLALTKRESGLAQVSSSISKGYVQYTITADQKKLGESGITAGQIAQQLMTSSSTANNDALTTIKRNGQDLDVFVKVSDNNLKRIKDLTKQTIQSPMGKQVKISDIAVVEKGQSPQSITKRDGKLYAEVTAKVTAKNVSAVTQTLQKKIDRVAKPDGASVSFSGVTEQMNDSFSQLGMAMLAAILIVYFVLVVTFGGGLAPFAILFSLPFAIIGSLIALLISGETISVSSMIGALMLIGIVITNAVVLIDRVIHREKAGHGTREALLEAAGTRIRPILMTAIATICALMPLASGMEGSGGLISKGLAVTVIGGITSSTILTLFIVPIVYETLMKIRSKFRRKKIEA
ncbi:efflux RND transporter permease subunit [Sporolactobacillus spathodeae]|uniref:HAE1 family hydrophobic/amphiphilic exporter-1 n=1 Tax=Sporolactobacillus spathodeae TaxID=1465502 RepID=A0ABS2Q4F9_9BACL|nr:efflux RND transporter permease subunit [Sporolactobacillus spathodeae]MBM7656661.1 HAE1 family hydrophobic/amphiphilic exporter-1 [Sporolactobacillus spathodeae]